MKLTPYINYAGNAGEALNFYKEVFNGTITQLGRYGDSPMPVDEDYKNKIIHARLEFDGNLIMISDAAKGYPALASGQIQLSMEIGDPEQIESVFSKMAEGGTVKMPLADQFWGAKFGMLTDRFGISWMFNCEQKQA